jgi:hypothetical protein
MRRKTKQRGFGGSLGCHHTSKHDLAVLWRNNDYELSQEINAQNGTSNSCLQETGSKKFALKLGRFCDESSVARVGKPSLSPSPKFTAT